MSVRPGPLLRSALSAVLAPRVTLVARALPARALGAVTLGAVLLLAAGLVGAAGALPAVAVAVLVAAALPGMALVYLGYAIRVARWRSSRPCPGPERSAGPERRRRTWPPGSPPPVARTACRCAGFLGLGVLTSGLTAAGLPLVGPEHREWLAGLGLTAAAVLYATGLLEVPGIRGSRIVRLRLVLDGASVGLLLALAAWLLVPNPGDYHPLAHVSLMVVATCAAITVAALLRAYRRHDPGTRALVLRCGGGALVAVAGQALLVVAVEVGGWAGPYPAAELARWALFVAALLVVSGPPLIWTGARQVITMAEAESLDERFGGYPMLALPLAAAVVAMGYHVVSEGVRGHSTLLLAMVIGTLLAVRELLVAVNLRRWVRRLAGQEAHLLVLVADLRQQRNLERTVRLLATTDQRTGLPNQRELLRAIAGRARGALIVIGLQGLQAVSDLRGHAAGDAVLAEVARRLRANIGPNDLAARLEGSRFAVVTGGPPIEAYGLAVGLMAALAAPYELPGRPVSVTASAGLATLGAAGGPADLDEVLHRAELALRRAYQLGRNQVEWYDDGLQEQLVRRLDLERHLPGAAGRGELDLAFQPVAELDSERPVGVEALLRWRHPVLGRVLPEELIPVADQVRVGREIGDWVLHTACRRAAAWRRAGHDLWLGVNVSARQLAGREFVSGLAVALSVHQIPPERLTIEIAAGQIGEELPTVASQLGKVRGLGVRTALDQVGAGGTDLAWLRRLPLDMVKLATPEAAQGSAGLAAGVVDLSRRLGLTVVAARLEAEEQREVVRAAGCRFGQGYLIAPPAPADRFAAYLDAVRDVEARAAGSSYE